MAILDLNTVKEALQMAGKIELYPKILETQEKLLEMQEKISKLEAENSKLKQELTTKASLNYENNAYWITNEEKKDGPFCSRCWDVEKNTVRLKPSANRAFHSCPECKTVVQTNPGYNPPYTPMGPPAFR